MKQLKKITRSIVIASEASQSQSHGVTRHCEAASRFPHWVLHNSIRQCKEDKRSAARRGNPLGECEKLFREHALALLSLSFRNNISHTNHSGIPQSLNSSNHFTHLTHLTHFKKAAFTLAEILITLAVIGIVAAMTIPTVMNKYQQKVSETRLAKFYSVMNNAIQLSEIDNGDKKYWRFENKCSDSDSYSKECLVPIFEQYFKPYLKITGYEYDPNYFNPSNMQGGLLVKFADGSTAAFTYSVRSVFIYPVGSHVKDKNHQTSGKDVFGFNFYTSNCAGERCKYLLGKGFEPGIPFEWDGTEETLPCLKRAQLNGWKFPDDCNPFK